MKSEKAVKLFLSGLNCSQAIVCTYGVKYSITFDSAAKISCGLAGGLETCGAVSGAIMVLGMEFASSDLTDRYFKERTYETVADFNHHFKKIFGTVKCPELLKKLNIEKNQFIKKPGTDQINFCANIVRVTSDLLEEILNLNALDERNEK
jgi:C_GCAxxG_C_C family probable redox protein